MEVLVIDNINKKTRYRPFKRNFKLKVNSIKKFIFNKINRIQYTNTEMTKSSSSQGGSKRIRYASIKGCCGLQRNGFLR